MSRLLFVIVAAWMMSIAGCSSTQNIAADANEIRTESRELVKHGNAIKDGEVVSRAERIDALAANIHGELPGVADKVPAWVSMLTWAAVAVVAVAVLLIGWQSGVFSGLRVLLGWLPRKKVSQAELAVDMLDDTRPEGERELVAALRASDKEFDAAYRRAQARRKAKT